MAADVPLLSPLAADFCGDLAAPFWALAFSWEA